MRTLERAGAKSAAPFAHDAAGRIGPNAIIRLVEAVAAADGPAAAALLAAARLDYAPDRLPEEMVDEAEVVALHRALVAAFGIAAGLRLAEEAGRRTADYLLAHRIPRAAQMVLRLLPPRAASRVLLLAISRHAWTFAGSGRLAVGTGLPLAIDVVGGPLMTAGAASPTVSRYYAATFRRLYQVLVSRKTRVTDLIAAVDGVPASCLLLDWR